MASTFDFTSYLTSLTSLPLPASSVQIHPLSGGYTNHTARASFTPPLTVHGHTLHTVVLKHAPPHLASDPSQPLSVERQIVEARALEVLAGGEVGGIKLGLGDVLRKFPSMRVPGLVWHDLERNVLWITDLGRSKTLSEYLLNPADSDSTAQDEGIASDLGEFLAALHTVTRNPPAEAVRQLANPAGTQETYAYLANLTLSTLTNAGVSDAEVLAARVRRALEEGGEGDDACLGMVDFWPESVLVGRDVESGAGTVEGEGKTWCGLVDWEYFGRTSAGGEVGMFVAHLHIHLLTPSIPPNIALRIRAFLSTFLRSYAVYSSPPSPTFKRHALAAHGREMVNGVEIYGEKLDEAAKVRMVQIGVGSLRVAGESEGQGVNLGALGSGEGENGFVKDAFEVLGF